MTLSLSKLWHSSAAVTRGGGVRRFVDRVRFTARARALSDVLQPLFDAPSGSLLARSMAARPNLLEIAIAPYISAAWDPAIRVGEFVAHVEQLEQTSVPLAFDVDHMIEIMPMPECGAGYHLLLDKPVWFQKEGTLALNLFQGDVRLFTIAFALASREGERIAIIGGIQGRNLDGILDIYREMTRTAHGLRPRDLLIDLFKAFCREVGAKRLLAVSDANRHHRHPYFGKAPDRDLPLDYDAIWEDRGGVVVGDGFYELSLDRATRSDDEIPAKKRAMYKKRYALMEELEARQSLAMLSAKPQKAWDAK
jgi:uncharacterized protein VirK/YbjX